MKKLYVRAKSKRDLNEMLAAGDQVLGRSYGLDNAGLYGLDCLTETCLIVVYSKMVSGNPVPISYGRIGRRRPKRQRHGQQGRGCRTGG